jgi:MoaA/NifB/PqqE/SkfB family radical SAM enzyme
MNDTLKQDLYHELLTIEATLARDRPARGGEVAAARPSRERLVDMAAEVGEILVQRPYLSGKEVAARMKLGKDQLTLLYKMLQRSNVSQGYFRASRNRDYFKVVRHYFDSGSYTLVFFVGTTCPSRCLYCPNVKIDKLGRRRLATYEGAKEQKLSRQAIGRVFDDLSAMKNDGIDLLVKISGGLEPLTDLATTQAIVELARQKEIPAKLFTNGLLLEDPAKREVALAGGDIRISLSTSDEEKYKEICVPRSKRRAGHNPLSTLKESIRRLVKERPAIHPACKIGFNCIVVPENHRDLLSMLDLASELGIDYVDFRPDYFSSYDAGTLSAMQASIEEARDAVDRRCGDRPFATFAGSLSRDDLYWHPWRGTCDAFRQSDFKLFISPYGNCSPVHFGAFPHSSAASWNSLSRYSIGTISSTRGLLDVLSSPSRKPEIEMKKLNPFELMLSLEINRTNEDEDWGLPPGANPYQTRRRADLPAELSSALDSVEDGSRP